MIRRIASHENLTNLFAGTLDDVRVGPGGWTSNDVVAIYQIGADPDHDGLSTWQEYQLGTNPVNYDTDGDGLSDGWEVANHTSPTNPDITPPTIILTIPVTGQVWRIQP